MSKNWDLLQYSHFKKVENVSDDLYRIPVKKKPLHRGVYGNVYLAYRFGDNDCKFIAKVMKLRKTEEKNHFALECCLAIRAGEQGYGPKVVSCYIATKPNHGILIMERWTDDMDDTDVSRDDMEKIYEKIQAMHNDGVFHQDLYMRNILYRVNKQTRVKEFAISDYGLAFPMETVTPELRAADVVSLLFGEWEPTKSMFDYGIDKIHVDSEGFLESSMEELRDMMHIEKQHWLQGLQWKVYHRIQWNEEKQTLQIEKLNKKKLKTISLIDGIGFYSHILGHSDIYVMKHLGVKSIQAKCAFSVYVTPEDEDTIDETVEQFFLTF